MTIECGYVRVPAGQIHYRREHTPSAPTIVFLHQTAASSRMFEAIMRELAGRYDCIAIDTPGFGNSFVPSEPPSMRYYVDRILEATLALGVKTFHLFGHHTGAAIACEMAAVAPERVLSLGMIGPLQVTPEYRKERLAAAKQLQLAADGSHLLEMWKRVTTLGLDEKGALPALELCHREAVDALNAGTRWHYGYLAVFQQDFPALLAQVRCPILMMCGPRDTLWRWFPAARAARPDAVSIELPGGLYVCDEYPAVVAEHLTRFIASR